MVLLTVIFNTEFIQGKKKYHDIKKNLKIP
jgi:hypothetical protein